MELRQAFGIVLKRYRLKAKISQEELSYKADVDRTYISFLETAKRMPSIETLFKLADGLNVEPDEFILEVKKACDG